MARNDIYICNVPIFSLVRFVLYHFCSYRLLFLLFILYVSPHYENHKRPYLSAPSREANKQYCYIGLLQKPHEYMHVYIQHKHKHLQTYNNTCTVMPAYEHNYTHWQIHGRTFTYINSHTYSNKCDLKIKYMCTEPKNCTSYEKFFKTGYNEVKVKL